MGQEKHIEKSFEDLPRGDLHLKEHPIDSKTVYKGNFLELKLDHIKLPDGKVGYREYLTHPGAVAIVALLDDGRLLLERQYRYPINQAVIEIPAGKLDPQELALDCAKRELKEETGYEALDWEFLGRIHPVISYSNEFIDIYLAKNLRFGNAKLDDGEFLDVFAASLKELSEWIDQGLVTDVKTIISSYWLKDYLQKIDD